jgi:hypothetical protein
MTIRRLTDYAAILIFDTTGALINWGEIGDKPGYQTANYVDTSLHLIWQKDSGFTIVGDNNPNGNNHNAFAMHWVPKPVPVVARKFSPTQMQKNKQYNPQLLGVECFLRLMARSPQG